MKEHPCNLCGKIFERKSNWIYHTQNKKHPCVNINLNNNNNDNDNIPLCVEIKKNKDNKDNKYNKDNKDNKEMEKQEKQENQENQENQLFTYPCEHCKKTFTRKYSLDRHLDGRCKIKLEFDKKQKQNVIL